MTPTMQFRARTAGEAGTTPGDPSLPDNNLYLISDIVRIGGLGDASTGTVYALSMTYDARIGMVKEHKKATYMTDQDPMIVEKVGSQYESAKDLFAAATGINKQAEVATDVNTFITTQSGLGHTLASLVGSYGGATTLSSTGIGTAWMIVRGGGDFGVVPEPSTIIMLISAGLGLMVYGWRRWRRN